MSVHDGHRGRVKERFLKEGIMGMQEHEILEFLLFYCIPRRDTNVIAHNLINRFGNLAKVLDAPIRELKKVEGMGENAAIFLRLVKELIGSYHVSRSKESLILTSYEECAEYLKPFFYGLQTETVMLLSLDAKCMVLDCRVIGEGSVTSAGVPIRKIVDTALSTNAVSVVLAHNHPGGLAIPSQEDRAVTNRVALALQYVDIVLTDHIVVCENESISMSLSKMYDRNNLTDSLGYL